MKPASVKRLGFLLPSLIGTLGFFLVPLCYCLIFSMSATFGRFTFAGFQNFVSLFGSHTFLLALQNTFLLMFLYIAALLILSLAVDYLLDSSKTVMGMLTLSAVVMFLPSALIVSCVSAFPVLYEGMPRLGFFLMFLWKHLGINCLILKTASARMDPGWLEAAQLDGAGKFRAFCQIEFFHLLPHLKFLFIFDTICFFKMFRESYLLYGLYPPEPVYMIQNFFFNNFQNANYQRLSSGAVITVALLFAVNLLVYKAGEKHELL